MPPTVTDQELAQEVRAALDAFNQALSRARAAGLTIEVYTLDVTTLHDLLRSPYQDTVKVVDVTIRRDYSVNY